MSGTARAVVPSYDSSLVFSTAQLTGCTASGQGSVGAGLCHFLSVSSRRQERPAMNRRSPGSPANRSRRRSRRRRASSRRKSALVGNWAMASARVERFGVMTFPQSIGQNRRLPCRVTKKAFALRGVAGKRRLVTAHTFSRHSDSDVGPLGRFDPFATPSGNDRYFACAVRRRRFPVGASPTRRTLQPEATGAVMEERRNG